MSNTTFQSPFVVKRPNHGPLQVMQSEDLERGQVYELVEGPEQKVRVMVITRQVYMNCSGGRKIECKFPPDNSVITKFTYMVGLEQYPATGQWDRYTHIRRIQRK